MGIRQDISIRTIVRHMPLVNGIVFLEYETKIEMDQHPGSILVRWKAYKMEAHLVIGIIVIQSSTPVNHEPYSSQSNYPNGHLLQFV